MQLRCTIPSRRIYILCVTDVDVAPSTRQREDAITEAVTEISERRAVIDQAKGLLMYVYGFHADAAFEVLRARSQESNIKLRTLAAQLLDDVRILKPGDPALPSRVAFERLLLTTHERVRD
jgi:ANTAR domain